jgi:hypothetical protein
VTTATRSRIAQLVLIVVGLLIVVYPLTLGASQALMCRGQLMGPGDACPKADGSGRQTYEQRVHDAATARPIMITVGLAVVGFGVVLLVTRTRRNSPDPSVP